MGCVPKLIHCDLQDWFWRRRLRRTSFIPRIVRAPRCASSRPLSNSVLSNLPIWESRSLVHDLGQHLSRDARRGLEPIQTANVGATSAVMTGLYMSSGFNPQLAKMHF